MTTTDPLGDWFRHIGTKLSDTDHEAGIKALSWARDQFHPTRTNPTDAEVEAAARAMFDVADEQMHFPTKFDRAPEPLADTYRRMAREALVAARKVAGR